MIAPEDIRCDTTALPARVVDDYSRYLLTLAFYPACLLIGRIATAIDGFTGSDTLELLLRFSEAVDEGRLR
jgi:hypothetical protein